MHSPVPIIPVIDLKGDVVVHAVGGRREEYRPIRSRLCDSAEPTAVAQALLERFSPPQLYVADLDAIAGCEPAWDIYDRLARLGTRLMVDSGVRDVARARTMADFRARDESLLDVIVGLESVDTPARLSEIASAVDRERLVFSLDLKQGVPLSDAPAWRGMRPTEIAGAALAAGVRRLIILDLSDVGSAAGPSTLALCRAIRAAHPHATLIAGGGVRGREDLEAIAAAGCEAVLVASALHDGRL